MPSKHLIAAFLKAHHTIAPAAMHLGPISHHWTGTQGELIIVCALFLAGFFAIVGLVSRSRNSG